MRRAALCLAVGVLLGGSGWALWVGTEQVPVERLVANLRARVVEAPGDAHRHYQLGRACGLAFALRARTLTSYPGMFLEGSQQPDLESLAVQESRGPAEDEPWQVLRRGSEETLELLETAVREHRIALELDDTRADYHLGLGYVLASGAHLAAQLDTAPLLGADPLDADRVRTYEPFFLDLVERAGAQEWDAEDLDTWGSSERIAYLDSRRTDPRADVQGTAEQLLTRYWRRRALEAYLEAFRIAAPADSAREFVDFQGNRELGLRSLVAHEAGQAILDLNDVWMELVTPELLEEVRSTLAGLDELPGAPFVTPIVLRLDGRTGLAEHLDPTRVVRFDLDGDGRAERRTWVKPDTGLLVWDPEGRGEVTSGRQLFGSATWWMFFRDGYEALDALDDDRDGWLFGAELDGLALWRDADGDAVSDPGEVEGLACLGVVALATHADTLDGLAPGATRGAWLADGRCVATWDWVAEPVPEPPQASAPERVAGDGDPVRASYSVRDVEGWSVHVDAAVGEDALELLAVKLFDVRRAVPAPALAKLRRVPIWLSAADTACACACYHVSADWLSANGHDPAKARAVEITRSDLFLDWSREQPAMVLHELAHAYFDRELSSEQRERLQAALERARASGEYDSVLRVHGTRERHYALGNATEFFAEMSECWMGTNDYWPFVRAELADVDPETAALVAELWGETAQEPAQPRRSRR